MRNRTRTQANGAIVRNDYVVDDVSELDDVDDVTKPADCVRVCRCMIREWSLRLSSINVQMKKIVTNRRVNTRIRSAACNGDSRRRRRRRASADADRYHRRRCSG